VDLSCPACGIRGGFWRPFGYVGGRHLPLRFAGTQISRARATTIRCLIDRLSEPDLTQSSPLLASAVSVPELIAKRAPVVLALILSIFALAAPEALGAASLGADPPSWDFGSREPGSGPSAPKVITWTNTGDTTLTPTSEFLGSFTLDSEVFVVTERTCGELFFTPRQTCTTEVSFDPKTPGYKHAVLGLNMQNPGSTDQVYFEVKLSGSGAGVEAMPPLPPAPVPGRVALLRHPQQKTVNRFAEFFFRTYLGVRYMCKLDNRRESKCRAPVRFDHLSSGAHRLAIHALNVEEVSGPITVFNWSIRAIHGMSTSRKSDK